MLLIVAMFCKFGVSKKEQIVFGRCLLYTEQSPLFCLDGGTNICERLK